MLNYQLIALQEVKKRNESKITTEKVSGQISLPQINKDYKLQSGMISISNKIYSIGEIITLAGQTIIIARLMSKNNENISNQYEQNLIELQKAFLTSEVTSSALKDINICEEVKNIINEMIAKSKEQDTQVEEKFSEISVDHIKLGDSNIEALQLQGINPYNKRTQGIDVSVQEDIR